MSDPNLKELMAKAQAMQKQMQAAQDQLSQAEVIGEAGGGLVKVIINGRHDAKKTIISDAALKEPKEILEGLITAAINDATRKIEKVMQVKIAELSKSILPPEDEDK